MRLLSWENIPEPLLVRILGFVTVPDIANAALTCRRWYEISEDNSLWRGLLRRRFRLTRTKQPPRIRDPETSWKQEYCRLVDRTPVICTQELGAHRDEVLHVSFSNSGEEFVTCSKDATVVVWRLGAGHRADQEYLENMLRYLWRYTWASKFNSTDSLLLVAGVVSDVNGEIAIFKRTEERGNLNQQPFSVLCRVSNNPYDVMGDWASETHFFSGRLSMVEAALYMCEADPSLPSNTTSPSASMVIKNVVLRLQDESTNYMRCLHVTSRNQFHGDKVFDQLDNRVQLFEEQSVDESCKRVLQENNVCLIFLSNCESLAPHQIGFCRVKPEDLTRVPCIRSPDRVINLEGHIVGLALSPDGRYLYVNVRRWPANSLPNLLESPPIASEIEMRVVELQTLNLLDTTFSGHRGFTDSQGAFYIYIDVGDLLVSSGSEDNMGRIWDRHYGCLVSELQHRECVNAAAFCPTNQQLLVTVADDHTVKVWKSRELYRAENTDQKTFQIL